MSHTNYATKMKVLVIFCLALASCSNSGGTGGGRNQYTIQINAFGANLGSGAASLVVSETNSGASVTFSGNAASQTLNHQFASGDAYNLSIRNPTNPAQNCTLNSGTLSGTVSGNLTFGITCNIVLVNVSGTVTGLAAGTGAPLVLQFTNGTPSSKTMASNGVFAFTVPSGSAYSIAASQPTSPTQNCVPSANASGVAVSTAVTNVQVACSAVPFVVSGQVTGLTGGGLILADGLGDVTKPINPAAASFSFLIDSGKTYTISPQTEPTNPAETCNLLAPTATVGNSPITNVLVTCIPTSYPVSFSVQGTNGLGIQVALLVNGSTTPLTSVLVTSNNAYIFPVPVPSGSTYKVVVNAQNDATQNCFVWNINGSGTIRGLAPPAATVACHNVPSFAFTAGVMDSAIQPNAPAAFFYTLTDPTYSLGALTQFTDDTSGNNSTQQSGAYSSGIILDGAGTWNNGGLLGSIFVNPDTQIGQLNDYVSLGTLINPSTPPTSTIFNYSFLQPTVLSPGTTFSPYNELSQQTTVPGFITSTAFDQQDQTLSVCYQTASGLFFQAYSIQAGGTLQAVGTATMLTANPNFYNNGNCSLFLTFNNSGRFVYAFYGDTLANNYYLSGFKLSANPLQSTGAVVAGPLTLANPHGAQTYNGLPSIEPQGRFIYIVYTVCVPSGPCIWNINGFSILATSGALTSLGSLAGNEGSANSLLYEPSGSFAYFPNGQTLTPYSIDPITGVLGNFNSQTGTPGTPLVPSSIGQQVSSSNIDPSGTFIFLVPENGEKLLSYMINPVDGSLFELPPNGAPASTTYMQPTVDPSGQWVYAPTVTTNPMQSMQTSTTYSVFTFSAAGLQSLPKNNGTSFLDYDYLQLTPLIFQ